MTKDQVYQFLPHRDPFLFIDEVTSIEYPPEFKKEGAKPADILGCTIKAKYFVSEDMPCFKGHFPGNPVLPGVLQVEMMAQASVFSTVGLLKDPLNADLEVALLKVIDAKFRRPVKPNTELEIKATCIKVRYPIISFECEISSQGVVYSSTQLLASCQSKDISL